MLVIMASVLLVLTFFIWAGIPVYIIGGAVGKFSSNLVIIHLCISLSAGILFSLYFLPINLIVAKNVAETMARSSMNSFIRIQIMWIIACSLIFQIILIIAIQL